MSASCISKFVINVSSSAIYINKFVPFFQAERPFEFIECELHMTSQCQYFQARRYQARNRIGNSPIGLSEQLQLQTSDHKLQYCLLRFLKAASGSSNGGHLLAMVEPAQKELPVFHGQETSSGHHISSSRRSLLVLSPLNIVHHFCLC